MANAPKAKAPDIKVATHRVPVPRAGMLQALALRVGMLKALDLRVGMLKALGLKAVMLQALALRAAMLKAPAQFRPGSNQHRPATSPLHNPRQARRASPAPAVLHPSPAPRFRRSP